MKRIFPLLLLCAVLAGCTPQSHHPPVPETPPAAVTAPAPTPAPEPTPTSEPISPEKLEFSIVIDDKLLILGIQDGKFPWGSELEADNQKFWSMDGFDSFSFTCGENLTLGGLCLEAEGTENNGNLTRIENRNPDYKTYRGAYIGMPLEDFLALYPEAEQINTGGIGLAYSYTDEVHCGFDAIRFNFENDLLVEFKLSNGLDGWAY